MTFLPRAVGSRSCVSLWGVCVCGERNVKVSISDGLTPSLSRRVELKQVSNEEAGAEVAGGGCGAPGRWKRQVGLHGKLSARGLEIASVCMVGWGRNKCDFGLSDSESQGENRQLDNQVWSRENRSDVEWASSGQWGPGAGRGRRPSEGWEEPRGLRSTCCPSREDSGRSSWGSRN